MDIPPTEGLKAGAKIVLVIEDNPAQRVMAKRFLLRDGYSVLEAGSGEQGLKMAIALRPHIILLDWMLGARTQGLSICSTLKKSAQTRHIPIVVMTGARTQEDDELIALSEGADLYFTKEEIFGVEAWARFAGYMGSLLDRAAKFSGNPPQTLALPGIQFDFENHRVKVGGSWIVTLSTKQFDLLYLLAKRYPKAVSRKYLVRNLWKNAVRDREIDLAIYRLRNRLNQGGEDIIETVLGKGYRLKISPL